MDNRRQNNRIDAHDEGLRVINIIDGEQLGIVGPSGAGKSTALGLLLRLYDPQAGRVTLDGRDLRALTQQSLRRQTAIVTQEPFLFTGTIRDGATVNVGINNLQTITINPNVTGGTFKSISPRAKSRSSA